MTASSCSTTLSPGAIGQGFDAVGRQYAELLAQGGFESREIRVALEQARDPGLRPERCLARAGFQDRLVGSVTQRYRAGAEAHEYLFDGRRVE